MSIDSLTKKTLNTIQMPMDSAPIGTIQTYGAATAPSGWLLCDGLAVSRTTYAQLFAVIGTTYGAGDASTTFNTPDMRGVFAKGAGTTNRATGKDAKGNYYAGTLGTYLTDKFQGWQLGVSQDNVGARNYYTYAAARDNAQTLYSAAGFANLYLNTGTQGNVAMGKAMDDGTNGTPRTGLTTEPQSLGLTYIIKALTTYQTVQVNIPSASILSGSGAPATTPVFVGQIYLDTTAKRMYEAYGTSASTDWVITPFPMSYSRRYGAASRGATNTNVCIYAGAGESSGSDITYVNSATAGDSFTINTSGIYCISATGYSTAATFSLSINTGGSITNTFDQAECRAESINSASTIATASWTGYIAAAQKVWVLISQTPNNVTNYVNQISITRVG